MWFDGGFTLTTMCLHVRTIRFWPVKVQADGRVSSYQHHLFLGRWQPKQSWCWIPVWHNFKLTCIILFLLLFNWLDALDFLPLNNRIRENCTDSFQLLSKSLPVGALSKKIHSYQSLQGSLFSSCPFLDVMCLYCRKKCLKSKAREP